MTFDAGTWWLIITILGSVIGLLTYLIKRAVFGKVDKIESRVENLEKTCVPKETHEKAIQECKEDIKSIREDYTPKKLHEKDFDECKTDIKKIKEDYITKEDFFREQGKTDRKLDKIMDILLEMKGDK